MAVDLRGRSLLSLVEETPEEIRHLLDLSAELKAAKKAGAEERRLVGKNVALIFEKTSTRTRSSFELAGKWLSADTINLTGKGTSVSKGESLRDTVKTIDAMGVDMMIIRHMASGAPAQIAQWTKCSIVNAGDGMHEHPSQALLDAYTMRQRLGDLEGRHVALVGDLTHSRVFRSNVLCLATLGAKVTLVAPATLMPAGIGDWAKADGIELSHDLDAVLPTVDAVMMLRVQRERMSGGFFPTAREYAVTYGLTKERLRLLPDHAVICHPGPMNRGLEISGDAADAAQSLVLDQVSAGVAVRMSILYHLLSGDQSGEGDAA